MRFSLVVVPLVVACGGTVSVTEQQGDPLVCAATPTSMEDACAAAQRFRVDGVSAEFQAADGVVYVSYRNASSTAAWEYPSAQITADDERIQGLGQGPDLYALGACQTSAKLGHGFTLSAPIPSGTKIHFTFEPMAATGDGITTCGDTLAKTTLEVVVP